MSDEEEQDAMDRFMDTLSDEELKMISRVDGVADLLHKAFIFLGAYEPSSGDRV